MRLDIYGVRITATGRAETIAVSGYADDIAVYLTRYRENPKVLEIFEAFKNVPGLTINKNKSIVVQVGNQKTLTPDHTLGLTLLSPTNHCRYLVYKLGKAAFQLSTGTHVSKQYGHVYLWTVKRLTQSNTDPTLFVPLLYPNFCTLLGTAGCRRLLFHDLAS